MEMESELKYFWIVYLTTNTVNNHIYIGVHKTVNPNKFDGYLGDGCYADKPGSYNKAKTRFALAVQQFGPKVFKRTIIHVFDNEDDAYCLEGILVDKDFLARKDVYNMALGGKIGLGKSTSIPCYSYTLDGTFYKEYESITYAALSVSRGRTTIGRAILEKIKSANLFWSLDKVDKLDLTLYKTDSNKLKVYQYAITGNFECEYESIADAAKAINADSQAISRCLQLGYSVCNKYFSTEKKDQYSQAKFEHVRFKTPVYQYTLSGEFIKEFESAADARRQLNIKSDIGSAIRKGATCGGYQWSYEKLDNMPCIENKYIGKARKVAVYDLDGNLIEKFDTVSACMRKYSSVKQVLQGKRKTGNGCLFKYID